MENSPNSSTFKKAVGNRGEDIALEHYEAAGYIFVAKNVFVSRVGEIDLIVKRWVEAKTEYVFVEVKTRTNSKFGYGYESVTKSKLATMARCAIGWVGGNIDRTKERITYRLDICSIDFENEIPTIQVFENVS